MDLSLARGRYLGQLGNGMRNEFCPLQKGRGNEFGQRPINGCPCGGVAAPCGFLVDRRTVHVSTVQGEQLSKHVPYLSRAGARERRPLHQSRHCLSASKSAPPTALTMSERVPLAECCTALCSFHHSILADHFRF